MSASAAYRELRLRGFGQRAAGNLTAYLRGIRPVESGWTLYEIERLLFIRYLVSRGSSDAHSRVDSRHRHSGRKGREHMIGDHQPVFGTGG